MSNEIKQQREKEGAIVPASKRALVNGGSSVSAYLAAHGVGMAGTFFKFAKDGVFRKSSDDEEVPEGTEFVCIYDQVQAGWVKFAGKGVQPEHKQGAIFGGFVPPPRSELGDEDQEEWDTDLSGKPADPWQFQLLIPLQSVETGELFVFQTTSVTGRRAGDNLIGLCGRMEKNEPEHYPVIKLRISGFNHRDERVGWVKTPAFERIGKAPKANTTMADTAVDADLNDSVPF
jgi:hypothetical protein